MNRPTKDWPLISHGMECDSQWQWPLHECQLGCSLLEASESSSSGRSISFRRLVPFRGAGSLGASRQCLWLWGLALILDAPSTWFEHTFLVGLTCLAWSRLSTEFHFSHRHHHRDRQAPTCHPWSRRWRRGNLIRWHLQDSLILSRLVESISIQYKSCRSLAQVALPRGKLPVVQLSLGYRPKVESYSSRVESLLDSPTDCCFIRTEHDRGKETVLNRCRVSWIYGLAPSWGSEQMGSSPKHWSTHYRFGPLQCHRDAEGEVSLIC